MSNLSTQQNSDTIISKERKLIVLHTPKCGGSSLLASLKKGFGRAAVYGDYRHEIRQTASSPDNCRVIYGHFHAGKYQHLQNATWVTLLREPVDRILSLYFNWRFYPLEWLQNDEPKSPKALRWQVHRGHVDLLDFARLPAIAGTMHKRFFGGFDMSRFDLIILHSSYAAGVHALSERIGIPLVVQRRNVSSSRSDAYLESRHQIENDPVMMQRLKDILRKEIELFEHAASLPAAVHGSVLQSSVPVADTSDRPDPS